ncbi:hypothetical protein QBC41DRAFT_315239 [Cercophora samala]|uniref:Uncharacterized protein n=1 Tax=Cercophora samala TaxID=330535 RepID=A0AA39ZJ16_9PEZI|nr:hypothetical protein QBC41DRAFT_315239 [Cercophora samala]
MVGHHQSPSWIKEWYSHRQPRRHGNWKLGGLTVRGWVIWEEDRVGRLGWTDTAMAGWLAEGQPGWWDENDKWETINSYAYVITGGEPEPEPDKTVALPYQELWPNEEAVRDQ